MAQVHHQGKESNWVNDTVAERYANAENATGPFAKMLVRKANLAEATGDVCVLDIATGTGAAIREVYNAIPRDKWDGVKVVGSDVSQPMLDYLEKRGEKEGWTGLSTKIVDGNDMTCLEKNQFTHTLCTCGIFLFPSALKSIHALSKKGAFVGVSSWKSFAWMPLTDHTISLMPSNPYNPSAAEIAKRLYSGRAWDEPTYIAEQFREAGFEKVETQVEKIIAKVGTPEMFLEAMQFPLKMVIAAFWPEDKRADYLENFNAIMLKEVESKMNDDGIVELEFEGIIGWGWKP